MTRNFVGLRRAIVKATICEKIGSKQKESSHKTNTLSYVILFANSSRKNQNLRAVHSEVPARKTLDEQYT